MKNIVRQLNGQKTAYYGTEALEKGQRQKTVALYVKYFYCLTVKPIPTSGSDAFLWSN